MGNATGIELGPDSCVLVAARAGATGSEVSAVHVIEPADFPGVGVALTEALRGARRQKKFPRRARVVLWSLEQPASVQDAVVRSAIRPLLAAGFRVEAVLTPTQALAAVASTRGRRTDGATAWLSINTHGAAIVIVRGSDTLFARTLSWTYSTGSISVREQLLQRYTFVSHIAPELKAGMAMVRTRDGVVVDTVVTCGDLPDLRSLTMPLIEELDLEVETLDSSAGLHAVGSASEDRFAEWAPTIRLACAAARRRGVRWRSRPRSLSVSWASPGMPPAVAQRYTRSISVSTPCRPSLGICRPAFLTRRPHRVRNHWPRRPHCHRRRSNRLCSLPCPRHRPWFRSLSRRRRP